MRPNKRPHDQIELKMIYSRNRILSKSKIRFIRKKMNDLQCQCHLTKAFGTGRSPVMPNC